MSSIMHSITRKWIGRCWRMQGEKPSLWRAKRSGGRRKLLKRGFMIWQEPSPILSHRAQPCHEQHSIPLLQPGRPCATQLHFGHRSAPLLHIGHSFFLSHGSYFALILGFRRRSTSLHHLGCQSASLFSFRCHSTFSVSLRRHYAVLLMFGRHSTFLLH